MSNILPFIEDTTGQKWKRQKYKEEPESKKSTPVISKENTPTVALSYDEVNDDTDELIALRGEGRYFGVTDPDDESGLSRQSLGPLCANCHKRGHIRSKCKTVVCHKCGAVDEHYESQCPTTIICGKCSEKGHIMSECKSKVVKRQYCRTCDSFKHGEDNCPSIWRSYITKPEKKGDDEESLVLPRIFCYNCGSDEHYGDECAQFRTSRVPNFGSSFSGNNLPRKLRPIYFLRLKTSNSDSTYIPQASARDYKSSYDNSRNHNNKNNNNNTNGKYNRYEGFGNKGFDRRSNTQPSRSGFVPSRPPNNGLPQRPRPIPFNSAPSRSGTLKRDYDSGSKPTRSGLISNRKSKNPKKLKY
ncbi:mRNA processing and export modulator, putative [Candida maltosa Xu316]|uniref:mRNA processing and export modulator, putative n=1 Tax=Candida maltosa (strain Xu316) TaxID=1245528 RepID=M3K4D7_CANMX|nr:mRNA processing and export modulator, putative [Candida maltosa Xu316]